jgi:hypothetical protein
VIKTSFSLTLRHLLYYPAGTYITGNVSRKIFYLHNKTTVPSLIVPQPLFSRRFSVLSQSSTSLIVRRMGNQLQMNSPVIQEEEQEMDVDEEIQPDSTSKKRKDVSGTNVTSGNESSSKKVKKAGEKKKVSGMLKKTDRIIL